MVYVGGRLRPILDVLASTAWRGTPAVQDGQFLVQPSNLVPGTSPESMRETLTTLYRHARRWAPGLEVPFFVPPVRIEMLDAAGKFRVDDESYASVAISAEHIGDAEATLLILCHEACHDILRQSQLNHRHDADLDEITTDLAMFICGFGELVLRGHCRIGRGHHRRDRVHLGYLNSLEYQQAHDYVLSLRAAQRLPGRFDLAALVAEEPPRSPPKKAEGGNGAVHLGCGSAMCKRTFRAKLRRHGKPWPIQCPACGVFLYPINILQHAIANELEPHRAELRLPRDGRLVECTSDTLWMLAKPIDAAAPPLPGASALLAEMLEAASPAFDMPAPLKNAEPPVPSPSPEPPAPMQVQETLVDASVPAPPGASASPAEMVEAAAPTLDLPAPSNDAVPPVSSPSPEPPAPMQAREALTPLKHPEPPLRTAKNPIVAWALALLLGLGLGLVMAWVISSR